MTEKRRHPISEIRAMVISLFASSLLKAIRTDSAREREVYFHHAVALAGALGSLDVEVDCFVLRLDPVVRRAGVVLDNCPKTLKEALERTWHENRDVDIWVKLKLLAYSASRYLGTVEVRRTFEEL